MEMVHNSSILQMRYVDPDIFCLADEEEMALPSRLAATGWSKPLKNSLSQQGQHNRGGDEAGRKLP